MDEAALQDATAVRVAVRVRPLITREVLQGSRPCISADGPCVTVGRDRRFTFDHAFGPSTQQEQIYQEVVSPLVESCFDGFNVTVLAYGQTGSGKTFTMGTGECKHEEQLGIAPRVIRHVFQGIEARRHQAAFYVRAQFLEIYNEDVKDLLLPPAEQAVKWVSREREQGQGPAAGGGGGGITLRDAGDGTIMVIGASEEPAECAEDLAELLERGMALRATSSTCANEQSSRSHAILTIIIEQHMLVSGSVDTTGTSSGGGAGPPPSEGQGGGIAAAGEVRTAKLHLVDLAGSERTKQLRSSMQGPRFRETVNINQGLLALGNVISALGDERRRGTHVPYRESKLTRLLQDSLGGNSRTAMIACVSPADEVLEETLNTLKYANRAKNIRNKPVVNRALPASSLSPLCGVVLELQLQVLQQLVAQLPDGSPLARELPPLADLMAGMEPAAEPSACLEVLTRMKGALALAGGTARGGSKGSAGDRGGSAGSGQAAGGPQSASGSAGALGGAAVVGVEVEDLVSGCSRVIAGILHGLAEMEAAGHVNREAREHILRTLDASTLRLLPAVRSAGPRGPAVAVGNSPPTPAGGLGPVPDTASPAAQQPDGAGPGAAASLGGQDASREREKALEARIRELEAELSSCRSELSSCRSELSSYRSELSSCRSELESAREDLDRDEVIFADKMKELQEARAAGDDLRQRLNEAEARHAKEVEDLRRQVVALSALDSHAGSRSPGPSRVNSLRNRIRPSSASGSASGCGSGSGTPLVRQRPMSETNPAGSRAADAEAAAPLAAAARDGGGSDTDGERGGEEDEVLYDEELLSYISETDYTEQHRREVLESDAALREELAEVLREKAAAEAERAAIERAALAQRSSFDRARAALEQQLSWLSGNIAKQQEQLTAAQAAEREARDLAAKWEERARELESAIEAREEALQRLRSELEAVEGNAQRSAEERAALRQQYEQRIAAVVAQVNTLQRQLQQHTSSGGGDKRERQQSAERMAASEAELARLRSQQADLRKQLSERVARYERESAARVKELAALRKAASAARSRMQVLEQENRAQRLLLREKQQEVMAAEQRLRDSQRGAAAAAATVHRSRSSSPGSRGYLGRGSTVSADAASQSSLSRGLLRGRPGSGGGGANASRSTGGGAGRRQSISPGRPLPARSVGSTARSAASQQQQGELAAEEGFAGEQGAVQQSVVLQQQQQASKAAAPALTAEQEQELRDWAEQLMSVVADVAGVEARLEVLASRHRELLGRRELLHRERAQFGLRTQRRAEQLGQAIVACEAELADLMSRVPSPRYDTPPASQQCTPRDGTAAEGAASGVAAAGVAAGAAVGGGDGLARPSRGGGGGFGGSQALLSDEWVALQQRIADVSHAKASLEQRLRNGRLLEEREQQIIDSLDDQLDDLEIQLSYILDELAERRGALAQLHRRRDLLQQRAADLEPGGLRVALSAATDAVGHRIYQVRQLEAALAASEAGAARREAQLQVRLRESLVSLSAHLATLEGASPRSSACLDSSELRNLLGIYLDLSPSLSSGVLGGGSASAPGGTPGAALAPAPAAPAPSGAQRPSAPPGAAPANTAVIPPDEAPPPSTTTPTSVVRKTPAHFGAPPWAASLGPKAGVAPTARGPEAAGSCAGSLAGWARPEQSSRADAVVPPFLPMQCQQQQQRSQQRLAAAGRVQEDVDLSLQALPIKSGSAVGISAVASAILPAEQPLHTPSAAQPRRRSSGGQGNHSVVFACPTEPCSNGGLRPTAAAAGADDPQVCRASGGSSRSSDASGSSAADTPVVLPNGSDDADELAQPPTPSHLRTGAAGGGAGTAGGGGGGGGGGGILRRAGSFDSVGSTGSSGPAGSGSMKRVTWGAQMVIDPTASTSTASSGGGTGAVSSAGHGMGGGVGYGTTAAAGTGRVKERSILDRATTARLAHVARVASRTNGDAGSSGGGGIGGGGSVGLRLTGDASRLRDGERGRARERDEEGGRVHARGWRVDGPAEEQGGARRRSSSAGGAIGGGSTSSGGGSADSSDGVAGLTRRSSAGGGFGGEGGEDGCEPDVALAWVPPGQSSFSIASAAMDDTAAAADAHRGGDSGGAHDADVTAAEGCLGPRPSLRSFNPWAASEPVVKQRRSAWEQQQQQQHGQQRQGQVLLLASAEEQGLVDMGRSASGDADGDGDEDDTSTQDSELAPRSCEGEDSVVGVQVTGPAGRTGAPAGDWQHPLVGSAEPSSRQLLTLHLPPPRTLSGPGGRTVRDECGRYNASSNSTNNNPHNNNSNSSAAATLTGDPPRYTDGQPGVLTGGPAASRQRPAPAVAPVTGYDDEPNGRAHQKGGSRTDTDDDEELEEHVRLLAQAAAQARLEAPAETPRLLVPALTTQGTWPQAAGSRGGPNSGQGYQRRGYGGGAVEDEFVVVQTRSEEASLDLDLEEEEVLPMNVLMAASSPTPPARRRLGSGPLVGVSTATATARGPPPADGAARGSLPLSAPIPSHQPPPLPEPARSISPVPHHGRHQQRAQHQQPKPGPFTSPAPMVVGTPLSEALMPYKAHLKRPGAGQGGSSGGGAAGANRAATPEGRRLAALNSTVVGFASPQQQQQQQLQQQQRSVLPTGVWLPTSGDVKAGPAGAPQQARPQQPWRPGPAGPGAEASARGFGSYLEKDERPVVASRTTPRQRSFLP